MKAFKFFTIGCLLILLNFETYAQEKNVDYISILKQTGPYDPNAGQTFPDFTYQSADNENLVFLRKKYNLDSVAGKGNEITRAIRLLNWMHKTVPHEDVRNLPLLNADNIITTYKTTHQAQGCYGLAISLDEIYLSMGFKSRTVICFSEGYPKRDGGHVVNVVYIDSLKKWVWMDAENNAYVQDDKGNYMSVQDVREHLVAGLPLVLNSDANYHNVPMKIDKYLYQFMAEHIYRMLCPLYSSYNSQTFEPGKVITYVELLPVNSHEPPIDGFETRWSKNGSVVTYHTHNDKLFWAVPAK